MKRAERWTFLTLDRRSPRPRIDAVSDLMLEFMTLEEPQSMNGPRHVSEWMKTLLSGKFGTRLFVLFGADGRAAAMLLATQCLGFGGRWIALQEIYVRRDDRRRGAGLALGEEFRKWLLEQGIRYIAAVTDGKNSAVLHLAKQFGMSRHAAVLLDGDVSTSKPPAKSR